MEGTNGREWSEAPSSSSSDFYATGSPREQPVCPVAPDVAMNNTDQAELPDKADDREESDSEMDLSESRSPSPDHTTSVVISQQSRVAPAASTAMSKRKLSIEGGNANETVYTATEGAKKPRLSAELVEHRREWMTALDLPVELWQQIFLYLSPANLARCLRVCRTFRSYLMDTKARSATNKADAKDLSKVRVLDSDAVWANARKMTYPNMPRPLARLTEHQILQLIGNDWCQFCGRPPVPSQPTTPFNRGPGADGVRVFWPFGIRSCGPCIQQYTMKDVEVLRSQAASLRNGLPHCFLTPDLHFVPDSQRTAQGGIPAHLRVAKVYFSHDAQSVVEEYDTAVGLGVGAAEEWKKGLITRGKEAMADAARWEQWESQLPYGTGLSQVLREYDVSSFPTSMGQLYGSTVVSNGMQPPMAMQGPSLYSQRAQAPFAHAQAFPQPSAFPPSAYPAYTTGPGPSYGSYQAYPQQAKPTKTAQDVEEAIRSRRADIERRCLELNPPLDPAALQHISAFQATMQIAQPMTDEFWESFLKPRIMAEREAAEAIEQARKDQLIYLQAAVPHSAQDEPYTRPAKEVYDKEYEHAQEPLRRRLGEYADEYVNYQWKNVAVDKFNSPIFAVQVIEFVDRRYREEKLAGMLPVPDHTSRVAGQSTPYPDPFLSLDNMKWVYDNKIRQRTDIHGRELFICSGCPDTKLPKWLAFEGLIQHYGAKHTTAFSKGNVVVHWQTAEWPSDLPFVRNPNYYMKHEKKSFEPRGQGRAQRTPQASGASFNASAGGRLLSESPFISDNHQATTGSTSYYQQVAEYSGHQYSGQSQSQASTSGRQQAAETTKQHQAESTSEAQLNMLCNDLSSIWSSLEGIKEDVLIGPIRVQVTINRAVARFESRFGRIPDLDLLTAVLTTKPEVRPFKEAKGLACKLCVADENEGSAKYPSYYGRIQSVKLYNTSSLASHFNIMHLSQSHRRALDWTTSMIELPEPEIVSRLLRAPGMDDEKLNTIAIVFPSAFPWPLPKIGKIDGSQGDSGLASKLLDRHFKKKADPPKSKKKKGQHGISGTPARDESEPLPEAGEDEYDPRRPMALPTEDQSRRGFSPSESSHSSTVFNFAPETLAALNQLNSYSASSRQTTIGNRTERSPSVGRAEPVNVAPNISEILAQLTGRPSQPQFAQHPPHQTATPPDTSSRSSSQPQHLYTEAYGRPAQVSPRQHVEQRATSLRYAPQPPTYLESAEPLARYEAHDARLAQSYNASQFEQNRAQSYAEPPQPLSPPRYRPVYEEVPHYSQPPTQHAHALMYRPEPPPTTQYVQVQPDRERYAQPQPYQYARSSPEHKYVDEYGRELKLVPVDAAPAPIQYMQHPAEQQRAYSQYGPPQPAAAYAGSPPVATYAGSPTLSQFAPQQYDGRPVYYEQGGEFARGSVPRR